MCIIILRLVIGLAAHGSGEHLYGGLAWIRVCGKFVELVELDYI